MQFLFFGDSGNVCPQEVVPNLNERVEELAQDEYDDNMFWEDMMLERSHDLYLEEMQNEETNESAAMNESNTRFVHTSLG